MISYLGSILGKVRCTLDGILHFKLSLFRIIHYIVKSGDHFPLFLSKGMYAQEYPLYPHQGRQGELASET